MRAPWDGYGGAAGAGAFASTLLLATLKSMRATVNAVFAGVLVSAAALLVFPLTAQLAIALPAMAALGFGISATNVGINTALQTLAPDHLRGRVVSFFSSTRVGFDAIGGLIAGAIAAWSSAPATLLGEGVLLLAVTLWLLTRAGDLRRAVS